MAGKTFDVVALGELLVDFTDNGLSEQGKRTSTRARRSSGSGILTSAC